MHVVREKQSKRILHISPSSSPTGLSGADLYPAFDATSMEVGWTPGMFMPTYFDIDSMGQVVELSDEEAVVRGLRELAPAEKLVAGKLVLKSNDELATEGLVDLGALKQQLLAACTQTALELRTRLIPDYKLQNAAIGVYDDAKVAAFRATINAFRDEVHRVEAQIQEATKPSELERIQPNFPVRVLDAEPGG